MLVTLYCIAHGDAYKRYAEQLRQDVLHWFLPGESEFFILPGIPGERGHNWPYVSATRYRVLLNYLHLMSGEYLFQIDADTRIVSPIGREILADGVTVTVHPGFSNGTDPALFPYERNPGSTAFVQHGDGNTYHPGAFVGGRRAEFLELAHYVADAVDADIQRGVHAVWYEESHLNRYLIDHPPALVLDRRYCWWGFQWGSDPAALGAKVVHLDKTAAEFAARD